MNFEFFIAKKIAGKYKGNLSRPYINIAVLSIALGIAVMLTSVSILTGFQKEIRDKIIGFGAHIKINYYDSNSSYENAPVSKNQSFYQEFKKLKQVKNINVFGLKPGIIKTNEQIQGILLKGIDEDYDLNFFKSKIIEGRMFHKKKETSDSIIISKNLAEKLNLKVNDKMLTYFIQDPPRFRNFIISGVYETGLEDFDMLYVFCDINHIRKLNSWDEDMVSGFEITLHNYNQLPEVYDYIYSNLGYNMNAETIRQLYPEIFDWLDLMDMNVLIILIIMFFVSSITMISTLLVLILERTNMIGILKALGIKNNGIRKIFLYNAVYIILKGLLLGNMITLIICTLQDKYKIIKLPQHSYYVSYVPINMDWTNFLLINLGTLILSILILIGPSFISTRINPVKAINFK